MKISELKKFIVAKKFKSKNWIDNLDERKKEELEFHNFDREKSDEDILRKQKDLNVHSNKKYYSITENQLKYQYDWFKNVKNKVLDYACGDGVESIKASKFGAELVIGIDISDIQLNAKKVANNLGIKNCYFSSRLQSTELPNESIDIILCKGCYII